MIPLNECKHGYVYRIESRNLSCGVFNSTNKGFIGIREKFGDYYLFTEYHWETGAPFGTVQPLEELGPLPKDIGVWVSGGTFDQLTNRRMDYDSTRGWYFLDTGEPAENAQPVAIPNRALFDYLDRDIRRLK